MQNNNFGLLYIVIFNFFPIRPPPGLLPVLGPLERYRRRLHLTRPCLVALGQILIWVCCRIFLTANIKGMHQKQLLTARRPAIMNFATYSFLYWTIDAPYFDGIRSTISRRCRIYWIKNWRFHKPSHHCWILNWFIFCKKWKWIKFNIFTVAKKS